MFKVQERGSKLETTNSNSKQAHDRILLHRRATLINTRLQQGERWQSWDGEPLQRFFDTAPRSSEQNR